MRLSALGAVAAFVAAGVDMGRPGCPCVPVAHKLTGKCFNVELPDGSTACYPEKYGNGCAEWDAMLEPYCSPSNEETFCMKPWCYVEKNYVGSNSTI